VIDVRTLAPQELEVVDARLPLHRLGQPDGEYLVAWDDLDPVGHAFVDWRRNPPQLGDVYVAEPSRRRGVASALTAAAEQRASERGHTTLGLEVSADNAAAVALYEKLGYRPTGERRRVTGTIVIRGTPMDVDDTIVAMKRPLGR